MVIVGTISIRYNMNRLPCFVLFSFDLLWIISIVVAETEHGETMCCLTSRSGCTWPLLPLMPLFLSPQLSARDMDWCEILMLSFFNRSDILPLKWIMSLFHSSSKSISRKIPTRNGIFIRYLIDWYVTPLRILCRCLFSLAILIIRSNISICQQSSSWRRFTKIKCGTIKECPRHRTNYAPDVYTRSSMSAERM